MGTAFFEKNDYSYWLYLFKEAEPNDYWTVLKNFFFLFFLFVEDYLIQYLNIGSILSGGNVLFLLFSPSPKFLERKKNDKKKANYKSSLACLSIYDRTSTFPINSTVFEGNYKWL